MNDSRRAKTAVLYHRVSKVEQDETSAAHALLDAARARGLEVLEVVEETGSGARNDRPGLRRVLALAHAGRVGFVLVWKLDRFGRSVLDLVTNVEQLERVGVTLVAASQGIEIGPGASATITSRFTFNVLAAVAEFERELIRDTARRRGRTLGRPRSSGGPLCDV